MIKFFRKIRQNLISEGKTGKYLKYAIGEIVLVMIGILLALQVNNWNELRKKEKIEIQLNHNIIGDLNSEYPIIEGKIRAIKSYQNLHFQLFDESQGKAEYDPTTYYNSLFYISSFDMFLNENHSESLSLITEDKTYDILKKYIKQEKNTKSVMDEWNEFKIHEIRPFLAKHGIKNTKEVFNLQSNDWFMLSTTNLIIYPKLIEQYGTMELDQLLFTLRFKTTWLLHNLKLLKESNREFEEYLKNKLGIVEQHKSTTPIELIILLTEGIAIDEIIEIIKKEDPDEPIYDISENTINNLGYYLMDDRKFNDALKIFKLAIELYPDSYNIHDSYGECLFKLKDYKNAIKAYERALELNPDSENSKKMLKFLTRKG